MIYSTKKVLLEVLGLNNFIIATPIKTTVHKMSSTLSERLIVGRDAGLQVNEYLVPGIIRSSILHTWYNNTMRARITTIDIPTWYTSAVPVNALHPSERHGWVLGFARRFGG